MIERCLGPVTQIPIGEGRQFDIAGQVIAVFHLRNGSVCATQASCPHRGGPLADGIVGGTTVICPLHGRKFDLTTGQALGDDCALSTFPAAVTEKGDIILTIATP